MSKHRSEAYKARRRKGGARFHVRQAKRRRAYMRRLARMTPEKREHIRFKAKLRYLRTHIPRPHKIKPPNLEIVRLGAEWRRAQRRLSYYFFDGRRKVLESYYRHHERNLEAKARRRREQAPNQRAAELLRKRARDVETVFGRRERTAKQRWITERLILLARDDGIYDLLKEQYTMANDLYDKLLAELITAKEQGDNYKSVKDEMWKKILKDQDRYLQMFFANWFNNHWSRDTKIKEYKPKTKLTPEQIKERRKSDANLRGIALMNMFLSDGETRVKEATGAQIRLEHGWLGLIAKHVKPTEVVGRVLTAQQLYNLRVQAEPPVKGQKVA
jgi:hypothetical protein